MPVLFFSSLISVAFIVFDSFYDLNDCNKRKQTSPYVMVGHGYIPVTFQSGSWVLARGLIIGPVHKGTNRIPKPVSEHDSDPFLI